MNGAWAVSFVRGHLRDHQYVDMAGESCRRRRLPAVPWCSSPPTEGRTIKSRSSVSGAEPSSRRSEDRSKPRDRER